MRKAVTLMWLLCFFLSIGSLITSFLTSANSVGGEWYIALGHGSFYVGKHRCTTPAEQAGFAGRTFSLGDFREDGWRWKPSPHYFRNQRVVVKGAVVPLYIPAIVFLCLLGGSISKLLTPRGDRIAGPYASGR